LLSGRRIWIIRPARDGVSEYVEGLTKGIQVVKLKQFLPVGEFNHPLGGHVVDRKEPLVQLITNPGGIRTVAVGAIRLKKP